MTDGTLVPPLRHPVARVLLVAFVLLHAVLALASTGLAPVPLVALLLLCGAAAVAVLPISPSRLPLVATVLAPLVGDALVLATLRPAGWPGYAAWPLGATTFTALALTLRGRFGAAWLLLGGMAAESVAWSLLNGAGALPGLNLVVRHAGTLLLGTLFAVGLRRSAATIAAYRAAERGREAMRAAALDAGVEQQRAADRFLRLSDTALEAIAAGVDVPASGLLALEGRLRDEMTARAVLTDRLNAALAAARARGVDAVVLADGDLPPAVRDRAADWLSERLTSGTTDRFVGRVRRTAGGIRVSARSDERADEMELSGADAALDVRTSG